jgi:hypothetical protein
MTVTLTWVCLPPDCARAGMQTGAATRYRPRYYRHGFDIDTLFWGALIFLAVFVCCFLVWKAIERLHNGTKFDGGGAVNQQRVSATPAERITAQSQPVTKPHKRLTELVAGRHGGGSADEGPRGRPPG